MKKSALDFNLAPFIAIWETTHACDLACVHCRAFAEPNPLARELSREEAMELVEEVAKLGAQVLVLSGGDPIKRPDLADLVRRGKELGLRMGTIPAASPRLSRWHVHSLKRAGLDQMALSLDSAFPDVHDRFRGVPGAYERTLKAVKWAHEVDMPLQINSVMARHNFGEVPQMVELVKSLKVVFWEVFFLVPMGRGSAIQGLSKDEYEEVFARLYELSQNAPFIVKVTEAPHFRRFYIEEKIRENGWDREKILAGGVKLPPQLVRALGPRGSIGLAPQGVNAGKGHLFISCEGDVFPSGFLPVAAGNIRTDRLERIYRESDLFTALRDPARLKGRCGECEYRAICGGSRARAFAVTGDYLAEEPCCGYIPSRHPSVSVRHTGVSASASGVEEGVLPSFPAPLV